MTEEIIKKALDYLANAEVFIQNEAPEIIQQIIKYGYWTNLFQLIICCIIFIIAISIFTYKILYPSLDKYDSAWDTFTFLTVLFSGLIGFGTFMGMMDASFWLIKVHFAPKVFVMKYLLNMKN